MSQHITHAPSEALRRRSVAAVATAALATGALAIPGVATAAAFAPSAAAATPKAISLTIAQHPRLIDRPETANDVIRFTNVPGVAWKLDDTDVVFASGRSTADVVVTDVSKATFRAVTDDPAYAWSAPAGAPVEWIFPKPSADQAPKITPGDVKMTWNDVPGTRDTATLKKITGVVWTVTTGTNVATYDSGSFGKKTEVTVPVTKDTTITVAADTGYQFDGTAPSFTNTVTDTTVVALVPATVDALASVGENPHDSIKGYGPGSAQESVKVEGIPGVTWQVGNRRAVAVKGTAYLPVDADDLINGKVTVKAIAGRGYSLPADYAGQELDFTDGASIPKTVVKDPQQGEVPDVTKVDLGGTSNDVLQLRGDQTFVWWVGQSVNGKIVFKALMAKNGVATYKPKFAKGAAEAKVYLKPVPIRGYTVDDTSLTKELTFTSAATDVPIVNQGVVSDTKVTFTPVPGIATWSVKYVAKPATATTAAAYKTFGVKPVDIATLGATSVVYDFGANSVPIVTTKAERDYSLVAAPTGP